MSSFLSADWPDLAPRPEGPPWWGVIASAFVVLLFGATVFLLRDIGRIKHDLTGGQDALSHLQLTQLDSRQSIENTLGKAHQQLQAGASLARQSVWLRLLAPLPKVGPQIAAARALSASAAQVGNLAYQAALQARAQLDAPRPGPAARLHLIDELRQDMATLDRQLGQVPTTTHGHLISTLAKAKVKLTTKLGQARSELRDGLTMTATLRTLLAGPKTYLILAGNNAEMRSGGITTAAGLVHFQGGAIVTSPFISSFDLFLPDAKAVTPPPDIARLYGWMFPGQEWRTTDTSPNWPEVAQLYSQMSANSSFGKVDGVMFVDVVTLHSVLSVIGPVTVDGFKYTASNVLGQLLYTNYLLYPTPESDQTRRDVQSDVARAAFGQLQNGKFSLPALAQQLEQDAKGRHLMAWSPDPAEEAMWTKLGAAGSLGANDLMVSVQNLSASKLDFFIKPIVTMAVQQFADHQRVDLYVTITNPRRTLTSPYIEGGTCCVLPGDQRIYQLFYLPGAAYKIDSYTPEFSTIGTDGPMEVVGMIYIVPYSQTTQVHISFYLPPSLTSVTVLPSSRLTPEQYSVNGAFHLSDAVAGKLPI
ncbi:MAG TPA: DUF4012 domain-containing protein [Acidimicrobiales bacterium]|nr:DUF4012 domain-containing protein [Acidimicrobiales bacterium]